MFDTPSNATSSVVLSSIHCRSFFDTLVTIWLLLLLIKFQLIQFQLAMHVLLFILNSNWVWYYYFTLSLLLYGWDSNSFNSISCRVQIQWLFKSDLNWDVWVPVLWEALKFGGGWKKERRRKLRWKQYWRWLKSRSLYSNVT